MTRAILSKFAIHASLAVLMVGEALAESIEHVDEVHGHGAEAGHAEVGHDSIAHHAEAAAHHANAAHGSGGLPQLDPTWFASQLFWLSLVFISLYIVFSKKVLPELSATIENRNERIQDDLAEAEKLKKDAEKVHMAYEETLEDSRNQAAALFSKIESDIKSNTDKALAEFRERSNNELQDSEKRISDATKEAMKDMDLIAAEVASEAAEKIVGIATDVDQAKSVIDSINKKAA